MTLVRSSPSGRGFEAASVAELVEVLGYTGAAPLAMTLMPAGHTPGLYLVGFDALVTTIGTGNLSRSVSYTSPSGATTSGSTGSSNATALGHMGNSGSSSWLTPLLLRSDGSAPIVLNFTSGLAGGAVVDIHAAATLFGVP